MRGTVQARKAIRGSIGYPTLKGDPGEDGYSPQASVTKSGNTATITITDKNGTTTAQITDGEKGDDGRTPKITANRIGDTTTIYSDSAPIAEIHDGTPGQDGDPGQDGVSPSATVTQTSSGATITITDKTGTTTASVANGQPGEDGHTPVKGTDYWTAADKAGIVDDVLASEEIADIEQDVSVLKSDLQQSAKLTESDKTGVDLDVTDSRGNVILRLADGHIQTKNFDSSDVADMESTLDEKLDNNLGATNAGKILRVDQNGDVVTDNMPATGDVMSKGTTATSDMDFTDINGNVVMRFKDGHVQTKNFDSSLMRQLSGKKWACIGDSLTEVNVRTTLHYHDYIAQETGIQIYNLGHSGCGYAKVGGYGKNFIGIAAEVPNDADVITIFGSGNDGSAGLELGTPTDTGTSTLCGCINATLDVIYANHPTVPIGVITPTPWANAEPSDSSTAMKNYSAAIVEICARRGIPCLDLYHCSNLHPTDANFRPLAYSKDDGDGVHPDETGHKIIAPRFRQFLFSLI